MKPNEMVFEASDNKVLVGAQKVAIPLECVEADEAGNKLEMLCVKYNVAAPWGWAGSTAEFKKGCFDASLAEIASGKHVAYIFAGEHSWDPKDIIAASSGKENVCKVAFESRDDGLYATLTAIDTAEGDTISKLVAGGALDTCSVGTLVEAYESETLANGEGERKVITAVQLNEVSMTIRPRFENTKVKEAASYSVETDALDGTDPEVKELLIKILEAVSPAEEEENLEAADTEKTEVEENNIIPLQLRKIAR